MGVLWLGIIFHGKNCSYNFTTALFWFTSICRHNRLTCHFLSNVINWPLMRRFTQMNMCWSSGSLLLLSFLLWGSKQNHNLCEKCNRASFSHVATSCLQYGGSTFTAFVFIQRELWLFWWQESDQLMGKVDRKTQRSTLKSACLSDSAAGFHKFTRPGWLAAKVKWSWKDSFNTVWDLEHFSQLITCIYQRVTSFGYITWCDNDSQMHRTHKPPCSCCSFSLFTCGLFPDIWSWYYPGKILLFSLSFASMSVVF